MTRRSVPRTVTTDEYRALTAHLDMRYTSNKRTRAMLALMFVAGLRCGEVCALAANSIDTDSGTVTVPFVTGLTKTGGRVVGLPLSPELDAAMSAWNDVRDASCPYLFHTTAGKRVDTSHMRRRVSRLQERAGIAGVHPHTLRHSYARNMLRSGVALPYIQSALGHANLSTTSVYLRIAEAEQVDVMRGVTAPV